MFSFDAAGCQVCPARMGCEQACFIVLQQVGKRIDVRDMIAEFEKRMAAPPGQSGEHEIDPALAHAATHAEPTIATPTRVTAMQRSAFVLSDRDQKLIATLPVKVGKKYAVLLKQGLQLVALDKIHRGENPFFAYGHKALWRAVDILIKEGSLTRGTLRDAYMTHEGWSEGTAFSRVTIAVQILTLLGVVIEKDKAFVVVPKINRETT